MGFQKVHQGRLAFLMLAGVFSIGLLIVGGFQLMEFTESTAFCGRLCHNVMNPEYTAYQASPHSNVLCSSCHVGPGASYLVKSKISGIPMILATLSGHYDKPIPAPVANLRPARETCEACHRPGKFSGDLVVTHTSYVNNQNNTSKVDTRVLRVGSGDATAPQGIHWHIAAQVWYLPLDDKRQQIGWVGVQGADGNYVSQYIDPELSKTIASPEIEKNKRLMDCIDCHNRATHVFQSPDELIDSALQQGKIDSSLPYIKKLGTDALYPQNSSLEQAYHKIEAINDYYKNNYPDVYLRENGSIDNAIKELKRVADLTTFPGMNVNWDTYPDNIGHQNSTGCFRCHGKLVESTGDTIGKTVNVSCTLCHYPITAQ